MENQTASTNPLLVNVGIPPFDKIKPEHVIPAIQHVLREAEIALLQLEQEYQPTWNGLLQPMEQMDIPFEYSWLPLTHLLGVKNSPELRQAYESVLHDVVAFSLKIRQSRVIYEGLKEIVDGDEWDEFSPAQKRVVELKLKSAEHAGVGLDGAKRDRFIEIEKELSQLQTDFSNHVLDATKDFFFDVTDKADTEGWPVNLKQLAAQIYHHANSETPSEFSSDAGPWRITLDIPSYLPFMQHSRNREQRKAVYHAQITRASSGKLDNAPLIDQILTLRKEKADILGFSSYASLSLDSKMASEVSNVEQMFEDLTQAAKAHSQKDYEEVQSMARDGGQADRVEPWDWMFWSERLRESRFDYTDEQLRPYFQLHKVLEGLFEIINKLFAVDIVAETDAYPGWHEDVRMYRVNDENGVQIASFYLDPYSRPHEKNGGAWMGECLNRKSVNGKVRLPIIHICCNGTPPIGDQPSLMSFREVETLFHEFGHALQGMLTTVNEAEVAGVNGVEWDAVELPSQFMENWCYHQPTLIGMTAHVETGEALPLELFEKIKASRTFQSGYQTTRQLLFGIVDITLHDSFTTNQGLTPFELYAQKARELSALPPYEHDRFLCAFNHIFAGGYAAGYYSYKWAEVLSADAFSAFEEVGLETDDKIRYMGLKFKDTVLALGGSVHPMEVFKRFRGREPKTDALLRHSGFTS